MRALKRRSVEREPTVWIGRNGLTEALLGQISRQLDANEMIKVKVHKGSLEDIEVSEIAGKIADQTGSEIVDVRGRTFSIYKQRKPKRVPPRMTAARSQ
jgi:RNA-binding protein